MKTRVSLKYFVSYCRFKDKLVKMIKDANSRFDNYSISPKIRQILLHWGCELTESDLL